MMSCELSIQKSYSFYPCDNLAAPESGDIVQNLIFIGAKFGVVPGLAATNGC
jgi:hypothetical protein